MNVNVPVTKFNSWARGQLSRAAGYIRQVSRDLVDIDADGLDPGMAGLGGGHDAEDAHTMRIRERRAIVQNSDGQFFERLGREEELTDQALIGILPEKYSDHGKESDQGQRNGGGISARKGSTKALSERFAQFALKPTGRNPEEQRKQINDLYLETLYTIVHRIGKTNDATSDEQLTRYAKAAFQVDDRTHQTLLERARREKPPILLLNVLLLEARDLIAKDIDGFSDPFVMLGLIPSSRKSNAPGSPESNADEPHSPTDYADAGGDSTATAEGGSGATSGRAHGKNQLLHRFSGSFRRKAGPHSRKSREATVEGADLGGIPARIIKASSVQRKTLYPKWNEKFQFVVGDQTDRFHLDIWDHDDENRSVLDVVTTLNQVQGLKGLGRYFKEVTQSARTSSGDLVDDFLGSVTVPIKDIPSAGLEQWFRLEGRSSKSEVSGQILLKLWLSTREEHRLSSTEEQRNDDFIFLEEDELVDVQQHKDLIKQLALYEVSRRGEPVSAFRAQQLHEQARLILHQHAIQSDLTELHQLMCQWLAYLQMLEMGIAYELLHEVFAQLCDRWKPMELDKDEEYVLADSLLQFASHCRATILRHRLQLRVRRAGSSRRRRSPSPKRTELEQFGEMLRCFRLVRDSAIYSQLVPCQGSFADDVRAALTESARAHIDAIRANIAARQLSPLQALCLLGQALNATIGRCAKFDALFRQHAPECDYADIAYAQFDSMLHEHIVSGMMSERRGALRTIMQVCHSDPPPSSSPSDFCQLSSVLLVHLALNEFAAHRASTQRCRQCRMDQLDWSEHFDRAIQRWLELALGSLKINKK